MNLLMLILNVVIVIIVVLATIGQKQFQSTRANNYMLLYMLFVLAMNIGYYIMAMRFRVPNIESTLCLCFFP